MLGSRRVIVPLSVLWFVNFGEHHFIESGLGSSTNTTFFSDLTANLGSLLFRLLTSLIYCRLLTHTRTVDSQKYMSRYVATVILVVESPLPFMVSSVFITPAGYGTYVLRFQFLGTVLTSVSQMLIEAWQGKKARARHQLSELCMGHTDLSSLGCLVGSAVAAPPRHCGK